MYHKKIGIVCLVMILMVGYSCSQSNPPSTDMRTLSTQVEASFTPSPIDTESLTTVEHQLKDGAYTWRQVIGRDGIKPIYHPKFVPGTEAPFKDTELIIGLEINGEAKAYPIGPLNGREMVNDTVGGVPVLVSW